MSEEVDYSEEAINRRIREVSALRDLCLSLGKATIIRDAAGETDGRDEPDDHDRD